MLNNDGKIITRGRNRMKTDTIFRRLVCLSAVFVILISFFTAPVQAKDDVDIIWLNTNDESYDFANTYNVAYNGELDWVMLEGWTGTAVFDAITGEPIKEFDYVDYTTSSELIKVGKKNADGTWNYGFIDKNGRSVISLGKNNASPFSEDFAVIQIEDADGKEKFGYIDTNGKNVIPGEYDEAYDFSDGMARVAIGTGGDRRYGFVNKSGDIVIPPKYDDAYDYSEGLACVRKNNEYSFIDKNGNAVISLGCEYDVVYSFFDGLARVSRADKCGFIDKCGRVVIPLEYDIDWTGQFAGGLVCVEKKGEFGCLDTNGKPVVPLEYSMPFSFSEGLAFVEKGTESSYINANGMTVIPMEEYDGFPLEEAYLHRFSGGLACVSKQDKYGFIDKGGNVIVPLEYDEAGYAESYPTATIFWVKNGLEFGVFKYQHPTYETRGGNEALPSPVIVAERIGINLHRYCLYDTPCTWHEAKAFCEAQGGHLVTITSQEEQAEIEALMENGVQCQYWIGLTKVNHVPNWITGEQVAYTNWDKGEPNSCSRTDGEQEDYIHIYNKANPVIRGSERYKWNDIFFDNVYPGEESFFDTVHVGFICEFDGLNEATESRNLLDHHMEGPSTEADNELAKIAAQLSNKAYDPDSIKGYLTWDLGFQEENIYEGNYVIERRYRRWSRGRLQTYEDEGSLAFVIAEKEYTGTDSDGNTSLLVIVARGSSTPYEYIMDVVTGANDTLPGFSEYPIYDIVKDFHNAIVEGLQRFPYKYDKHKILITGHSLGGAAANLVAANLTVSVGKDITYCYTFGAIDSIVSNGTISEGFENIHNITNYHDSFGPNGWPIFTAKGNTRYGKFGHIDLFYRDVDQGAAGQHQNHDMDTYIWALENNCVQYEIQENQKAVNSSTVSVSVNDQQIIWTDATPFIDENSRTMVPLRAVAEALGLTVSWDGAKREAIFTDGTKTLYFPIGSSIARTSSGETIQMDTAAVIKNDRTYAPIRYLAEYFGFGVDWDGESKTVLIFLIY